MRKGIIEAFADASSIPRCGSCVMTGAGDGVCAAALKRNDENESQASPTASDDGPEKNVLRDGLGTYKPTSLRTARLGGGLELRVVRYRIAADHVIVPHEAARRGRLRVGPAPRPVPRGIACRCFIPRSDHGAGGGPGGW